MAISIGFDIAIKPRFRWQSR